ASQPDARYYREVARIGVQVAEALAHAHEQGVLHRDIKPSNLLLDLHGTVWVTDFGLAKADDEQDLTRTGDIVGTVRYMAPERFLTDRSITARRASAPERLWRWARRNKVVAGLLAFIMLASLSATAVFYFQNRRLGVALKASEDDRREARLRQLDSMIAEAR